MDDVVIVIQISEVKREDANDLRAVGEVGQPETGVCILREAVEEDLHEFEGVARAIDYGDVRAEAAAPGYVVCTAIHGFHTFPVTWEVFNLQAVSTRTLFFYPPHDP